MQTVGAALHGHVDHRASAEAVLCRVGVGLDSELFQRLDRRHEIGDVDARVLGIGPIQADHLKRLANTVRAYGKASARNRKSAQTIATPRTLAELHTWNQHCKTDHIPAIQRQLDYAL